ncbi:MAG: GHMP kinase [Candidatus Aenigmarchaeota archaeon]
MIISKTPFRISFCGGGTDLKEYYSKKQGSVVSTAINKYVYVMVNGLFEKNRIVVKHTRTENVNDVKKIRHPIIREALKLVGISGGVEITSMGDIPSETGMGSSSAFTVGLLNALHAYLGGRKTPQALAEEACKVEIDFLKEPIGKQDQYISSYGGFRHTVFNPDETVNSGAITIPEHTKKELENNLLLFYTGITRKARDILSGQKKETKGKMEFLDKMRDISLELKGCLVRKDITRFGELLHQNWEYKKKLTSGITNPSIERHYNLALEAGALGGKILGAGGGGFLLFYVKKENQENVREALKNLREMDFSFESEGSKIVYRD